jgi:hypothetical protein
MLDNDILAHAPKILEILKQIITKQALLFQEITTWPVTEKGTLTTRSSLKYSHLMALK